jgi:Ca-activated chloride channel family protein
MFLNSDDYEAVISSESSLIGLNMEFKQQGKEELYSIYPVDGLAINDSTFAFLNNKKDGFEDKFLTLQNYLLSADGQKVLEKNGIRTWYGGVTDKSNKKIFDPDWGINTKDYLNVTRFPSKNMITKSLNLYIETLRKPTHVVFCLDYSGSMSGEGADQLVDAMDYILTYEKASKDSLQFSKYDKITVIPFGSSVIDVWDSTGDNTADLLRSIKYQSPYGSTALYDAVIKGIDILDKESDDYTKTIIAMTDGEVNVGSFDDLESAFKYSKKKVPVYSITFGDAEERQLNRIAELTNSKVFDGKKDLLRAFKEVRSYN